MHIFHHAGPACGISCMGIWLSVSTVCHRIQSSAEYCEFSILKIVSLNCSYQISDNVQVSGNVEDFVVHFLQKQHSSRQSRFGTAGLGIIIRTELSITASISCSLYTSG